MAIVKVYFNGKEFDVEKSANETTTLVSTASGSHVAILESITISTDRNPDLNIGEKGVVFGRGAVEGSGLGSKVEKKIIKPKGIFDERESNKVGFANLLYRTLVNALFKDEMEIEPLNLDGTVKPEYQS